MLTVMHRRPDGTETLFEARSVTRRPKKGEESVPPLGVIEAVLSEGDPDHPGMTLCLDISQPFGAVFVMNRYGSTVQKFMCPPLDIE